MIVLYDTGGQYLPVMKELVSKVELDACEQVNVCGTLEECVPHLKKKNPYIMDFRLVQECIYDDIDFCDEESLNKLYEMISPIGKIFGKLGKKLLYVMVLPESQINETDYLYDSLISNLNLMKGMNLKPLPQSFRTYISDTPNLAYTFTMLSRNAIVSARHMSIQKGKSKNEGNS